VGEPDGGNQQGSSGVPPTPCQPANCHPHPQHLQAQRQQERHSNLPALLTSWQAPQRKLGMADVRNPGSVVHLGKVTAGYKDARSATRAAASGLAAQPKPCCRHDSQAEHRSWMHGPTMQGSVTSWHRTPGWQSLIRRQHSHVQSSGCSNLRQRHSRACFLPFVRVQPMLVAKAHRLCGTHACRSHRHEHLQRTV